MYGSCDIMPLESHGYVKDVSITIFLSCSCLNRVTGGLNLGKIIKLRVHNIARPPLSISLVAWEIVAFQQWIHVLDSHKEEGIPNYISRQDIIE